MLTDPMARLFVEHLTVIDFSYLDYRRGLVGDSWIVDIELSGALDSQGMVVDFGEVKRHIKKGVEEAADHKLVIAAHSPGLTLSAEGGELAARYATEDGSTVDHRSPAEAVCLLDAAAVTKATLVEHLHHGIASLLPKNVVEVRIELRHEQGSGAYYHYSHGLKKHQGHCQRIAHGHRSRIEIFEDGQRSESLERAWAQRWRDVYIGTTTDLVTAPDAPRCRFAYCASEGDFLLELDRSRCYLIETDSTVEHLAQHVADELRNARPGAHYLVKAFEGINKGAIAES